MPRPRAVTQLDRKARGTTVWRTVIERAAEVLVLMERLCSGWQLEPPGLRAVVRRLVGERSGMYLFSGLRAMRSVTEDGGR